MTQDETEPSRTDDRPLPGDGTYPAAQDDTDRGTGTGTDSGIDSRGGDEPPPGPDAEPVYNDRDKLDFDPDEGLYTGTAVTGDTDIPGEHERVDDVPVDQDGDDTRSDSDSDSDGSA